MQIGIDATSLPHQPVGAGTYIAQLIRALAEVNTQHDLFVFVHNSGTRVFDNIPEGRITFLPVPDKMRALRLVWEQTRLPILAMELNLDLLHSLHYTSPLKLDCASVVTLHDMTFFMYPKLHTFPKRFLFPYYIRSSARRARILIAVSETTRQDAIRILKIPENKIVTIPNGVSGEFCPIHDQAVRETCRQRYNLPKKFLLFVGTIEPRKNLPMLLRAYHKLLKEDRSYHLVLVGRKGWMAGDVWKTIKALQLEDFIHLTGYIPFKDLPIIYNLAYALIYPSLYEGFGLPPVEAMACGIPVLASDIPVNRDHIGDAGILFPPGDEDALQEHLHRLLTDHRMQVEYSAKGLARSAAFSWRSCALATLEAYQRLESS